MADSRPKRATLLHQRTNSRSRLTTVSQTPRRSNLARSHSAQKPSRVYDTFTSKKLNLTIDMPGKQRMKQRQGRLKMLVKKIVPTEAILFFSFWLFGTLVSMQYGVVVTAANDLVGNRAPPGLILLAYTVPSILVRVFVPYIKFPDVSDLFSWVTFQRASDYSSFNTPGSLRTPRTPGMALRKADKVSQEVNYAARLSICAASSLVGLQLLAWSEEVGVRVLGIMMASLSSNLGDMSFFQLATRYPSMIARSFGGYAAGSGAAGLLGAFLYSLFTTTFHVSPSVVLSGIGIAPTIMLLTYFFLLPTPEEVEQATQEKQIDQASEGLFADEAPEENEEDGDEELIGSLKLGDKLRLVKPMIWGYMAPLATLMLLENLTTQGILPTILWNLPFSPSFTSKAVLLNSFFQSARDFYPFFYTVYQLAIFFGRTSITLFRLPGGNRRSSAAYWCLCAVEVGCFFTQLMQSLSMAGPPSTSGKDPMLVDPDGAVRFSPVVVGAAMFVMGLCGGLGMSNTYWRVSKKPLPPAVWQALDQARVKHLRGDVGGVVSPAPVQEDEGEGGYFARSRPRHRRQLSQPLVLGGNAVMMGVGTPREDGVVEEGRPGSADKVPQARSQADETAVREFLISTIAMPDTCAILVASVLSLWLQPTLCRWQMEGGRLMCGTT